LILVKSGVADSLRREIIAKRENKKITQTHKHTHTQHYTFSHTHKHNTYNNDEKNERSSTKSFFVSVCPPGFLVFLV